MGILPKYAICSEEMDPLGIVAVLYEFMREYPSCLLDLLREQRCCMCSHEFNDRLECPQKCVLETAFSKGAYLKNGIIPGSAISAFIVTRTFDEAYSSKRKDLIRSELKKRRNSVIRAGISKSEGISMKKLLHREQGGRCYYCEKKVQLSEVVLEHKTSIAKGGKHRADNLCAACADCNTEKGALDEMTFRTLKNKPSR